MFLFQHNYLLGKDQDSKKKKKSNKLFNGEALPGGVPVDPNGAGGGSPRPDPVRSGLYKFVARGWSG